MARRRRRQFSPLRLLRQIALWLCALWLAGFAVFLLLTFTSSAPNPLPPADGIVALTGGDDRVGEALALLADHQAPKLLISGAGQGTYLGDFTRDNAMAATRYAAAITIGHMAGTTHGNALETASWASAHHMHSLIIVTADYHMPRAMQEMRAAMPEMVLIPYPVRPPAMRTMLSLTTLRLLAGEYTKYLAVRSGLGRLAGLLHQSLS
jgi:uncharacterized SAM-binding protein YcdF (DUF218 family)